MTIKLKDEQRNDLKKRLRAEMRARGEDTSALSGATKGDLLAAASRLGIRVRTMDEINADKPAPAELFSPVEPEAEPQDAPQDETQDAPNAAAERMQSVLAPLGTGDFQTFHDELRRLAEEASRPAPAPQTVYVGDPASMPAHIPQRVSERRASDLFGIKTKPHADMKLAIWDAQDAPAIDPHYVWHKDTPAILTQLRRGRNIMLTGPAGTGKTSFPEQFAAQTRRPFVRISCQDQTEAAQLVGVLVPDGDGTKWRDGVLTAAIRRPGTVIVIDEPSAARPGALMVLQAIMDAGRALTIDETGERVPVADGVLIFLADNTAGSGDESGAYEGTRRMNRATLDRCGITVPFGYLDARTEAGIVHAKTGLHKDVASMLVNYAGVTRAETDSGSITHGVGLRRLLAWAELIADGIAPERAFDLSIWQTAAPDDRETLRQLFRTHIDAPAIARAMGA